MCQIVKFLTTSFFFIFNFVFTDENQNLNWNFENILYPKENFHQQFPDATIDSNGIIHVVWVEQYGNQNLSNIQNQLVREKIFHNRFKLTL